MKVSWVVEPKAPSTNAKRGWLVREQWTGSPGYTQYGPVETEDAAMLVVEIRQREVRDMVQQMAEQWKQKVVALRRGHSQ